MSRSAVAVLAFSMMWVNAYAQQDAPRTIVYKPPMLGAPSTRIGGGTRGVNLFTLAVLAPSDLSYTSMPQPTLRWYLSRPAAVTVKLTATDETIPTTERVLPVPAMAGIQTISLKELGARLQPGVDYKWQVSLIEDTTRVSRDAHVMGVIRFVPPTASLVSPLPGEDVVAHAAILAEHGYWYDALDALFSRYSSGESSRSAIGALLQQINLRIPLGN